MLIRIAKHEWRMLAADTTPWVALLVFALTIGYGVANGVRWVEFQHRSLAQASEEEARRFETLKDQIRKIEAGERPPTSNPQAPDAMGARLALKYAILPPSALAALSIGQSDVLPYYFKISTAAKESALTTNEIENPHRLLSGRFDLSFVIIYLYPLLILALSYDLLSQEKEQGTLAMLLSQPVSLATFVRGKIALRATLFLATVVVLSLVGLLVAGVDLMVGSGLARLGLWIGIVVAYGAFWFGAVLLVTSFGRNSAANAVALSAIWLLLVVVAPSTLNLVASAVYPMPSRVELISALRAASSEATEKGSGLLARYYEDHPELAAVSDEEKAMTDFAVTRLAVDEEIERSVRPVVEQYDIQLARQQALVDRFRFLSPAIVAQDALNDIAGTGSPRHRHFVSLVEDFHARWRKHFASLIARRALFTTASFDELPSFQFRDESFSAVAQRAILVFLALLGMAGLLWLVGSRRLRSYSVTS